MPKPRAVVVPCGAYSRMYFAVVCTVMVMKAFKLWNEPRYFRPVKSSCEYTHLRFACSTRDLPVKRMQSGEGGGAVNKGSHACERGGGKDGRAGKRERKLSLRYL